MNNGGSTSSNNQSLPNGAGTSFSHNPPQNPNPNPNSTPTSTSQTSQTSQTPPNPPVRAHILGQEISGLIDDPVPDSKAAPLPTDLNPLIDLSSILDDAPPEPEPVTPPPRPPEPEPEPEPPVEIPPEPLPSPKKRSKKPLIIAALIAAAALLISILAVLIYFLSRPRELTPIEIAFNTYANDLVYGSPSSEPIPNLPSPDQFYYHQKLSNSSKNDQTYLNQLTKEYNSFYNLLSSDQTFYASATNYRYLLDFLNLDPAGDRYSNANFISTYLKKGESATSDYLNETLASLPENNPYAAEFRSIKQRELSATFDYLLFLDDRGCINHETITIDDSCAKSLDLSMQTEPELYQYRERTKDEPLSYFQEDFSSDSADAGDASDFSDTSDSSDSPSSPSEYQTPYSVMHENANLAENLLKTDYNLLGEKLSALKNSL